MKNTTIILIAAGALLAGGFATAAYMNNRDSHPLPSGAEALPVAVEDGAVAVETMPEEAAVGGLQYADIVAVAPISEKERNYATVIGSEPVRETTSTTTPHEVCEDVVVQERLPERDGNAGGTIAGAVIGGVLGNQVGGGSGRKVATAAGAVAGGMIGNRVDRNHVGGKVVNRTERQCRTEHSTSESSRVTGYNVTYRNADGTTGTMRMDTKPGNRIAMGNTDKVVGYDVTYRFDGDERTIRLAAKPEGDRLPVIDGKVVTQTASVQ